MAITRVRSRWVNGNLHYYGTGKIIFDDNVELAFGTDADVELVFDGSKLLLTGAITAFSPITDPGNAGAIPVTKTGYCPLVSAGAETRTLAAPSFIGQELLLYAKTAVGNIVVTCATTFNETGNTVATFSAAGQALRLVAVEDGANLRWRCAVADGAALSTP